MFLPVFERDLRVRSRGRAAYWLRVLVALAGLLVCLPPLLESNPGSPGSDTGTEIFNAVIVAAFFLCCGACLLSADAIGTERRDGTLGLLMLTRVRGFDLLIGKLGASAVAGFCAMVAFMPVLMIPVLAGGIPAGEAVRKGAALGNTLFLTLAVGLYSSARTRERFNASLLALGIVATIVVAPWLLSELMASTSGQYASSLSTGVIIAGLSPLTTLSAANDSDFKLIPGFYYGSMAALQTLAWIFLAMAARRVRRTLRGWREGMEFELTSSTNSRRRPRAWSAQGAERSRPIEWLVRSQPGARKLLWLATSVVIGFLAFFSLLFNWAWASFDLSGTAFWLIYGVCSGGTDAMMAVVAGQFFHNSKRAGQLEPLMTTPVGARDILTGQWRALKELLAWPVAVCISAILIHSTFSINNTNPQGPMFGQFPGWTVAKFAGTWFFDIAVTIAGILAMCRLGMWLALRVQSRITIAICAAFLGTGVPALFRVVLSAVAQGFYPQLSMLADSWVITNWVDELAVLLYYLWLIRFAKARLERQTSSMAATSDPLFNWRRLLPRLSRI